MVPARLRPVHFVASEGPIAALDTGSGATAGDEEAAAKAAKAEMHYSTMNMTVGGQRVCSTDWEIDPAPIVRAAYLDPARSSPNQRLWCVPSLIAA